LATVKVDLGFPKFKDIPVPTGKCCPPFPLAPFRSTTLHLFLSLYNSTTAPAPVPAGAAPSAAAAAAAAGAPYAITPPDHVKYHGLFVTYDTDKDGYAHLIYTLLNA